MLFYLMVRCDTVEPRTLARFQSALGNFTLVLTVSSSCSFSGIDSSDGWSASRARDET